MENLFIISLCFLSFNLLSSEIKFSKDIAKNQIRIMKKDLSVLENMKYGQEGIEASLQRVWLVGRNLGKERVFKELQYLWSRRKVSAQNGISRLFEPSY